MWGINFRTIRSSSVKNVMCVLIGITLNLYIALGSIEKLAVLILPISEFKIVKVKVYRMK